MMVSVSEVDQMASPANSDLVICQNIKTKDIKCALFKALHSVLKVSNHYHKSIELEIWKDVVCASLYLQKTGQIGLLIHGIVPCDAQTNQNVKQQWDCRLWKQWFLKTSFRSRRSLAVGSLYLMQEKPSSPEKHVL